jgi:outer membrane lipoprotein SlyB
VTPQLAPPRVQCSVRLQAADKVKGAVIGGVAGAVLGGVIGN